MKRALVLTLAVALSGAFAHAQTDAEKAAAPAEKTDAKKSVKKDTKKEAKGEKKVETKNPVVVMETTLGNIEIELNQEKAPVSTANFLKYVDGGFYNGTIFHRVIPTFMIQGGGFTPDMKQKSTEAQIKNEAKNGLTNDRGTIAMARTNVVDSATSQFFINVKDNAMLNHAGEGARYGYAVFGKVIAGMDVVDKIKDVRTTSKMPHDDVPVEPVVIKSAKRK